MRFWFAILFVYLALCMTQCVSPMKAQYGVQAEQLARIPARIAVLPCRLWPQGARFIDQPATSLPPADFQALCSRFDQYVLQGFEGQPYMRGLSPKVVKSLLEQNKQAELLTQMDELWFRPGQACETCLHPTSYYREVIAPRPDWRIWSAAFSRATMQSDAMLLPLVVEAAQGELNDRGLSFSFRRASMVMLLIDSNNGQLIWIGGRSAETRLPAPSPLPDPEELFRNLFVSDLWQEFPGRQIN